MRRRLVPVNIVMASLLFILISFEPDQNVPRTAVMERGEDLYVQYCASCHGGEGKDISREHTSLTKAKLVMGPRAHLIRFLMNGTDTAGKSSAHTNVPPYIQMDDEQMADVITYIRNSFGNAAKPVFPAEVKKIRTAKKI